MPLANILVFFINILYKKKSLKKLSFTVRNIILNSILNCKILSKILLKIGFIVKSVVNLAIFVKLLKKKFRQF